VQLEQAARALREHADELITQARLIHDTPGEVSMQLDLLSAARTGRP
jgi:hypothetical protein